MPRLIGLVGAARSGKDSTADVLQGIGWQRVAFADPVKGTAMRLFGLTRRQCWGLGGYDREQVLPEWGLSVREILQRLGTEVGRNIHSEVWIRKALRSIHDLHQDGFHVVITDCRFPNEVEMIHKLNGEVWEVVRPGLDAVAAHASEALAADASFTPDRTVDNSGKLADLVDAVLAMVRDQGPA